MASFLQLNSLLDRITRSIDRDLKFMALKDTHTELAKLRTAHQSTSLPPPSSAHIPMLEQSTETKLNQCFLSCILSNGGEVGELAVQCLSLIVPLEHIQTCGELIKSLSAHVIDPNMGYDAALASDDDDESHTATIDRASMALSALTVIIPALEHSELVAHVASLTLPPVMDAIDRAVSTKTGDSQSLLAVLALFVKHHSASLSFMHDDLLTFLASLLAHRDRAVSRTAVAAIASLSPSLTGARFNRVVEIVNDQPQLIIALSQTSSQRLSSHASALLSALVPATLTLLASAQSLADGENSAAEMEAVDRTEANLWAIDSVIKNMGEYNVDAWQSLVPLLESSLAFDPNFVGDDNYDDADTRSDMSFDDTNGDEFSFDDDDDSGGGGGIDPDHEFVDDGIDDSELMTAEDTSTRIRRASCKAVQSMANTIKKLAPTAPANTNQRLFLHYHSQLTGTVKSLVLLLLKRFSERISHVRADVMATFESLALASIQCGIDVAQCLSSSTVSDAVKASLDINSVQKRVTGGNAEALAGLYRSLTFVSSFTAYNTLQSHAGALLSHTLAALSKLDAANEPSVIATLECIAALVAHNDTSSLPVTDIDNLVARIVELMSSTSFKIVNAAVSAAQSLLESSAVTSNEVQSRTPLGPIGITEVDYECGIEDRQAPAGTAVLSGTALRSMHESLLPLLNDVNRDRTTKNAALLSFGTIYARWPWKASTYASPPLQVFAILQLHIDVPTTRVEAARTIARLVRSSPLPTPEQPLMSIVTTLLSFTRQADRALQHRTIAALNNLTLRVHQAHADTTDRSATGPSTPLVTALLSATPSLLSILAAMSDWNADEIDASLTLLSSLVMLGMSHQLTRDTMLNDCTSSIFPRLYTLTTDASVAESHDITRRIVTVFATPFEILAVSRNAAAKQRQQLLWQTVLAQCEGQAAVASSIGTKQLCATIVAGCASFTSEPAVITRDMIGRVQSSADSTSIFPLLVLGALARRGSLPKSSIGPLMRVAVTNTNKESVGLALSGAFRVDPPAVTAHLVALMQDESESDSQAAALRAVKAIAEESETLPNETIDQLLPATLALTTSTTHTQLATGNVVRLARLSPDAGIIAISTILLAQHSSISIALLRSITKYAGESKYSAMMAVIVPLVLRQLSSESLEVRSMALSTLSSILTHSPAITLTQLLSIITAIAASCRVDDRFIVTKQFGPIARKFDEAINVRIDGYNLLLTILKSININQLIATGDSQRAVCSVQQLLISGYDDTIDIQIVVSQVMDFVLDRYDFTDAQLLALITVLVRVLSSVPVSDAQLDVMQHRAAVNAAAHTATQVKNIVNDSIVQYQSLQTSEGFVQLVVTLSKHNGDAAQ